MCELAFIRPSFSRFFPIMTDHNECMRQWQPRTAGEQRLKSTIEALEARFAPSQADGAASPEPTTVPPPTTSVSQSAASTVPSSDSDVVGGKRRQNKTGPRGQNKKLRVLSNKHAQLGNEVRIEIPQFFVGCYSDEELPLAKKFFEESLSKLKDAIASTTKDLKDGCKVVLSNHAEYVRAKTEFEAKKKEFEAWSAKEEARIRSLSKICEK